MLLSSIWLNSPEVHAEKPTTNTIFLNSIWGSSSLKFHWECSLIKNLPFLRTSLNDYQKRSFYFFFLTNYVYL